MSRATLRDRTAVGLGQAGLHEDAQLDEVGLTPARDRLPWLPTVGLPALVVITYLAVGWQRRFVSDDAFINYRVVKQILAGNGPVYNVGERVEVATSTLWLALLTVADAVSPIRLEWTAIFLGLALGAIGVAMGMAGALRLARVRWPDAKGWVVPAGALVYLGMSGAWDWATGGLENGLGIAWLGTCFHALVSLVSSERTRWRLPSVAVLVGLGVLVRPDFAAFSVGFGLPVAVVAWRTGQRRRLVATAAWALALPLAVQIFRMGYYGQLLPNTVYAKEGTASWWRQGWHYLVNFVGPYALLVPVVVAVGWLVAMWRSPAGDAARARDWKLVVAAVEGAAVLHLVSIVRTGGDYTHARLLLPAWFAVLLPLLAVRFGELRQRRGALAGALLLAWVVVSAVAFRPPVGTLPDMTTERTWTGIADARALNQAGGDHHPLVVEQFIGARVGQAMGRAGNQGLFHPLDHPPDEGAGGLPVHPAVNRSVLPASTLGVVGYAAPLDVWVYDRLGLADPVVARVELERRTVPGHEKVLGSAWVAAAWVDPDTPITDLATFTQHEQWSRRNAAVDLPVFDDPEAFADARQLATQALDCGALGELRHNVRAPLTPQRFVGNIVDAVRFHDFRFPADPGEAHAALCD